jgi:mono/diheme cytochrome c family protein
MRPAWEGSELVVRNIVATALGSSVLALGLFAVCHPEGRVVAGSDQAARGKELFATRGCAHCHGPAGVGGSIGPDLQMVRRRMKADEIYKQIHDGSKAMPAFGDQLTDDEIKDLVVFLRTKRKSIQPLQVVPAAAGSTGMGGDLSSLR